MATNGKVVQTNEFKVVRSSITRPADTDVYASIDAVSNVTTDAHFTFSNALAFDSRYSGELLGVRFYNSVTNTTDAAFSLYLFHTDFTDVADNAVFTLTDTEALTFIGAVSVGVADWELSLLNKFAYIAAGIPFKGLPDGVGSGNSAIYGQLVAKAAYIPAVSEVFTVDLLIRQD